MRIPLKIDFTFFSVTETTPMFLEVMDLKGVPKNWRAWQVLLEDIGFLEDYCYNQGYLGWIARTKTPEVIKHVKALGARYYDNSLVPQGYMMCFVKYVTKPDNYYSLKAHVKRVREVIDVRVPC